MQVSKEKPTHNCRFKVQVEPTPPHGAAFIKGRALEGKGKGVEGKAPKGKGRAPKGKGKGDKAKGKSKVGKDQVHVGEGARPNRWN